jgi:hypothetical protein
MNLEGKYKKRQYQGKVWAAGARLLVFMGEQETSVVDDLLSVGLCDRLAVVTVKGANVDARIAGYLQVHNGNAKAGYPPQMVVNGANIAPLLQEWGDDFLTITVTELL